MSKRPIDAFKNYLKDHLDSRFNLHSRIQLLPSRSSENRLVFLKRDDELSFGISGSKYRKYASLIPYLKQKQIKKAYLLGSAYSNHILGLTQLLIENRIEHSLYLYELHDKELLKNNPLTGNLHYLNLLTDLDKAVFFPRPRQEEMVDCLKTLASKSPHHIFIPEGGDFYPCLLGAMTLGEDFILQNATQPFNHIIVDAGTGLSAIGLILYLSLHQIKIHVHIVSMLVSEEDFKSKLLHYRSYLEEFLGISITNVLPYSFYTPSLNRSFGSVSVKLLSYIKNFAREEGVFLDPIYSGKLLLEADTIIKSHQLSGPTLIVHSGGALSLSGF